MERIRNRALVELEFCGNKVEVASETIETTPVKLSITKTQDCDYVAIGETIRYTVVIENECGGELSGLVFRDELDECVQFVGGSFHVDGHERDAEVIDGVLTYEIEELGSCDKVEITFEVLATETCCRGCTPPAERSRPPTIRTILPMSSAVSGTGVSGAIVFVKFPGGETRQTTVVLGNWVVTAPARLRPHEEVSAWQQEPGKEVSEIVTRTIAR